MSDRTNLIETISKIDMFSTFSRMLRTANAEDLLQGEGGFTVFVPTNDAFGKIPDPQMNGWLSETDQVSLKALLSYHIIPGKLFAANLSGAGTVKTLSGQEIKDLLFKDGTEVVGSSPQEFGEAIKAEMASMGKVIKAAGIRIE